MANKRGKNSNPTICWQCKNALKRCSWSRDFIPVENWKAIETELIVADKKHGIIQSFMVLECPQFVEG